MSDDKGQDKKPKPVIVVYFPIERINHRDVAKDFIEANKELSNEYHLVFIACKTDTVTLKHVL